MSAVTKEAPVSRETAHAAAAAVMGEAGRKPDHVTSRDKPSKDASFVALRTFGYGPKMIDRGQVFSFVGMPGDGRLRDLRYAAELEKGGTLYECPGCGEKFVSMGLRDGHTKARHTKSKFVPPAPPAREPGMSADEYRNVLDEWAKQAGRLADSQDERRDKLENEVAPLDLTKTAASRGA